MAKAYRCMKCGRECTNPLYVRLVATKCGLVKVRQRLLEKSLRRHLAIPIGHFCPECLLPHVRTFLGNENLLERLLGFLTE